MRLGGTILWSPLCSCSRGSAVVSIGLGPLEVAFTLPLLPNCTEGISCWHVCVVWTFAPLAWHVDVAIVLVVCAKVVAHNCLFSHSTWLHSCCTLSISGLGLIYNSVWYNFPLSLLFLRSLFFFLCWLFSSLELLHRYALTNFWLLLYSGIWGRLFSLSFCICWFSTHSSTSCTSCRTTLSLRHSLIL